MTQARWLWARLLRLRVREIPARIQGTLRSASARHRGPPPVCPGPAPRWVHGLGDVRVAPEVDPEKPLDLAGATWTRATRTHWHDDPAGAGTWPQERPWYLSVLTGCGDPRPLWELHRLQHLAAWALSDPTSEGPVDEARDWIDANPVGQGIAWAGAHEAAHRLVSLVLLGAATRHSAFRAAALDHAWWVLHHPSIGTSAANHRVGELAALALAAFALPDADIAAACRAAARDFPHVLDSQCNADGGGIEQSVSYHATNLEWALLARAAGLRGFDATLRAGATFLHHLLDATGTVPNIGDDDSGRVLPLGWGPENRYVLSIVGAVFAALGETPPEGWQPDLRSALLVGPAHDISSACRPVPPSATFPKAGLTVFRDGQRMLLFDHGPLGEPDLGAHGHADALALWIHDERGPVVGSRGTFRYNAEPAARAFFRGPNAHAVPTIVGRPASEPDGHPFLWRRRTDAKRLSCELSHPMVRAVLPLPNDEGALFRGLRRQDGLWTIDDEFAVAGPFTGRILWPFAPGVEVDIAGQSIHVHRQTRRVLTLHCSTGRLEKIEAGSRQAMAWHSPSYGTRVPASAVIVHVEGADATRVRTTIVWPTPIRVT